MERLVYPYEPGRAGIPFEEIFNFSRNGEKEGIVTGGSGRRLQYRIEDSLISIFDTKFGDRQMYARVEKRKARFGLTTKISQMDYNKEFPWTKHPDMFAKKFVGFALQYFRDMKIPVDICCGIWAPQSDNYKSYIKELEQSGDQVRAAMNTWSGQVFIGYGYSEICEKDIKEELSGCLIVEFHSPISPPKNITSSQ